jgi:hypothetical protein
MVCMKTARPLIALALTTAALVPAAAHAALPKPPPVKDGVTCQLKVEGSYRVSRVAHGGIPVQVACTGPARYFIQAEFPANTKQDRDMTVIFGHSAPPPVAFVREVRVTSAGTRTYHLKMGKAGIRVARRYHRSKLQVLFPIERQDGEIWSEPKLNRRTALVG